MIEICFKHHLQRYSYIGCKVCTNRCECVGTKNTSFTEEQVSRNLRIGRVKFGPQDPPPFLLVARGEQKKGGGESSR